MGHRGSCCDLCQRVFCLCSPLGVLVSGLTFRSLIHFEFIFVYGVRKCSSFILLQVVDQFSQHNLLKRLSLIHCIFLPLRQQKRHRCTEQTFWLCGRGRGWDDLGEWHWNMYNIICETNHQSRFNAWYRMLGAGALGWPRGMVWAGRWEGDSGWGTCVHLWQIHVDVWQNQYSIVK